MNHRYSAFPGTARRELPHQMGRSSLLFNGFAPGGCVESSLREVVDRDHFATLVEDCCADDSIEAHQRAVDRVGAGFGLVSHSGRITEGSSTFTISGPPGHRLEMERT